MRTTLMTSVLCSMGVTLSAYALYVEVKKEQDSKYTAGCDISASVSCSKVFTSKYGRGFGLLEHMIGRDHPLNLPNSVFGLVFYALQICLEMMRSLSSVKAQLFITSLANIGSVYLAAILYFVLEDLCVVCVSTYVVNFLLLVSNIIRWRHLSKQKPSSSRRRTNGVKKRQ